MSKLGYEGSFYSQRRIGWEFNTAFGNIVMWVALLSTIVMFLMPYWIFGGPLTFLWVTTPALWVVGIIGDGVIDGYKTLFKPLRAKNKALAQFMQDGYLTKESAKALRRYPIDFAKAIDKWNKLHPDKKIDPTQTYY